MRRFIIAALAACWAFTAGAVPPVMPAPFPATLSPYASAVLFGTGADGSVTISSGTTVLQRDMNYANLTLSGTGKIAANGFRIFVSSTLDISAAGAGALQNNGQSAYLGIRGNAPSYTTGVAVGGYRGSAGIGTATVGGSTANFANQSSMMMGGQGGNAGNGGAGTSAAGTGGTAGSWNNYADINGTLLPIKFNTPYTTVLSNVQGGLFSTGQFGNGGGAGGGDGTVFGGNGGYAGGPAGPLLVFARFIQRGTNTTTSIFQAIGSTGGSGISVTSGNAGGGGGAGGSGGGYIGVICEALLGTAITNALDASGGVGGPGGNGFGSGKGGNGGDGSYSGNIQVLNLSAGLPTVSTWNIAGTTGSTTVTITGASGGAASILRAAL